MYLSWLAESRHVSASTQNQALSALMFHESAVQRAIADAARRLDLTKRVGPHALPQGWIDKNASMSRPA
jgi:hypothetical protein